MRTGQLPTAWMVLTIGLVALTLLCGNRAAVTWGATAVANVDDWTTYENTTYGYSFKYPSFCRAERMPGACKAQPPEERGPACQCFLNAEDPNSVLLQAYLNNGDSLALATWQVAHYDTPAFNPPPDTDLPAWLRAQFPWLPGLPGSANTEVGGMAAVEVFTPRSAMAPSVVEVYYLRAGQLIRIQMLDVEVDANARLYDQMLASFGVSP